MEGLTNVEFYIIAFLFAVAVVAVSVRPAKDENKFEMFRDAEVVPCDPDSKQQLIITALDDSKLRIEHRRLRTSSDKKPAVHILISAEDIKIIEKQRSELDFEDQIMSTVYIIDNLKASHYHLYFDSYITNKYATAYFNNEPPYSGVVNLI